MSSRQLEDGKRTKVSFVSACYSTLIEAKGSGAQSRGFAVVSMKRKQGSQAKLRLGILSLSQNSAVEVFSAS
jgi:hypothetical protein